MVYECWVFPSISLVRGESISTGSSQPLKMLHVVRQRRGIKTLGRETQGFFLVNFFFSPALRVPPRCRTTVPTRDTAFNPLAVSMA